MLANLRRRGISYSLNFIFGWDGETESAFPATLKFLQHHKVPAAYFNILTPVKGTPALRPDAKRRPDTECPGN